MSCLPSPEADIFYNGSPDTEKERRFGLWSDAAVDVPAGGESGVDGWKMEVLLRTGGYRLRKQGFQVQSLTCHFALFDTPGRKCFHSWPWCFPL